MITCSNPISKKATQIDNLYAWCIVPFDSKERSPQERVQMLSKLGFNKYAYDWRQKHLSEMAAEWELAKKHNIEVIAVWMWIENSKDTVGRLSTDNEKVLDAIKETGLKTQLWVSFDADFFDKLVYQALSNDLHRQSYFSSDQGGKTGVMPQHNEDFFNAEQEEKNKRMGVRI